MADESKAPTPAGAVIATPPVAGPEDSYPSRLDFVERLFLQAKSPTVIIRLVARTYQVSHRTARKYLRRVKDRIGEIYKPTPEAAKARVEAMLLETWDTAKARVRYVPSKKELIAKPDPDTKTMVMVATRIGELEGAFAPIQMQHNHSGHVATPTYDDLIQRVATVIARRDANGTGEGTGRLGGVEVGAGGVGGESDAGGVEASSVEGSSADHAGGEGGRTESED